MGGSARSVQAFICHPGSPKDPAQARWWRRFYLIAALAIGIGSAVIRPPLTGVDEFQHITRVMTLSHGLVIPATTDSIVPDKRLEECEAELIDGLYLIYDKYRTTPTDDHFRFGEQLVGYPCRPGSKGPASVERSRAPAADLNPSIVYLPAAVGYRIGRPFGGLLQAVFAARVLQLLVAIGLTWSALLILRRAHALFVGVALVPCIAQFNGTVSADPVSNAFTFIWLALVLRTIDDVSETGEPPDRRRLGLLACAAVAVALSKPIAAPALLVVLMIPRVRQRRAHHLARTVRTILPASVIIGVWQSAIGARISIIRTGGIDSTRSAHHLAGHPLEFLLAVVRGLSSASEWRHALEQLVDFGVRPASTGLLLPAIVVTAICLSGVALAWRGSQGAGQIADSRSWSRIVVAVCVIAIGVLTVEYGLALSDMPTGGSHTTGLQGRYLLPLVLVAYLAVPARSGPPNPRTRLVAGVGITLILFANIWGLSSLFAISYT